MYEGYPSDIRLSAGTRMHVVLARHWYSGCSRFIFATETAVDYGNTARVHL